MMCSFQRFFWKYVMCEWLLGWLLCLQKATVSVRVYTGRRHLSPFSQRPEWKQNHVQHVLGVCQCHIVQFQGVPITLYLWQEWASSGLWFLYDQLAKNRAYIFKELLKRRKGVYDRLYVAHKALKCTIHGWAEKALTTPFDGYHAHEGFSLELGNTVALPPAKERETDPIQ